MECFLTLATAGFATFALFALGVGDLVFAALMFALSFEHAAALAWVSTRPTVGPREPAPAAPPSGGADWLGEPETAAETARIEMEERAADADREIYWDDAEDRIKYR